MIGKIGYFWSFMLIWVLFDVLELVGLFFFAIKPLSTEVKMITAFVIVWANAKDSDARRSNENDK